MIAGGRPRQEPIVVARIGAAHGVAGEVRLKSFAETPTDIGRYGTLADKDGRLFEVAAARPLGSSPDVLVVRFKGIDDRDAAEALNGVELSVPRERLQQPKLDEFYHADLIGLAAVTPVGEPLGAVVSVQNYGAGDLLEIAPPGGTPFLVPFTLAAVPDVDVGGGRVVVDPPPGLLDETAER
jgi:16S rRNA processing protein RimM